MGLGLVSQMIKIQKEQEAFERVHYYEFQKRMISSEHMKILKERGNLLVGCLKPSCIYQLKYNKEDQTLNIETFRGDVRGTANFAGWPHEKLMNYMCGGVVYEEDILVAKRRPEEEIVALEKAHKRQLLKNDIQFYLALLGLVTMIVLPIVLHYLKPR